MTEPSERPERRIRQARDLRKAATNPERLLWSVLRNGQRNGQKFRRQHPVGPYVLDFYCHAAQLAIEIDGMSHDNRATHDQRRMVYLESLGLAVLRFTNDDVLADVDAVANAILPAR